MAAIANLLIVSLSRLGAVARFLAMRPMTWWRDRLYLRLPRFAKTHAHVPEKYTPLRTPLLWMYEYEDAATL